MKKNFVGGIIILLFIVSFLLNKNVFKVINGTTGGGLSEDGSSHLFQFGEDIQLYYNYITPYENPQQLYSLYKLQLCLTDSNQFIGQHKKDLAFILSFLDKELIDSSIPIMFAKNFNETFLCKNKINNNNKDVIIDSIKKDYVLKVFIDNIASFIKLGRVVRDCTYSNPHDPTTVKECKESYYINTYYKISLHFNKNRLINVDINPLKPVLVSSGDVDDGRDIDFDFTYSIEWYLTQESSISRLTRNASQISLYTMIVSIVNSSLLSIIWIVILFYIYITFNKSRYNLMKSNHRNIYNNNNSNNNNNNNIEITYDYDNSNNHDIESSINEQKLYRHHQISSSSSSRYNNNNIHHHNNHENNNINSKKYNSNPKISKYNLLKPLRYSDLFISLIGLGFQLFLMFILVVVLLIWKSKTLSSKTILDSIIMAYPITSLFGGYISSFIYINHSSNNSNNNSDSISSNNNSNNNCSNGISNNNESCIKSCIYSSYFLPVVISIIVIFSKVIIGFSNDFDSINSLSIFKWDKLSSSILIMYFVGSPLSALSFYLNIRKHNKINSCSSSNNNSNSANEDSSLTSSSTSFIVELIISIANATSYSTQSYLNNSNNPDNSSIGGSNSKKYTSLFYNNYLLVLICGIFPFSIIYTFGESVLKYLFTNRGYIVINRWYTVELLGFLFVLVIGNLIFTFIIINYAKDHQWQWWSFSSTFSISIYIVAHFMLYQYQETQFNGFIQYYSFYIYTLIISSLFGIMSGSIGFLISNYYIFKLFLNK